MEFRVGDKIIVDCVEGHQSTTTTAEPQDKCNCNIGCGDYHSAQCAVWIEPAARCISCLLGEVEC